MTVVDCAQIPKLTAHYSLKWWADVGIKTSHSDHELSLKVITQKDCRLYKAQKEKTRERNTLHSPLNIARQSIKKYQWQNKAVNIQEIMTDKALPKCSKPNIKMSIAEYAYLFKISSDHFLQHLAQASHSQKMSTIR